MKNSLKLFSLSIALSIANISGFATNSEKNYIDSENIVFDEKKIYLYSEEGFLGPLTAIYSDEKGLYILTQDESNQSTEQTPVYTPKAQDPLVQLTGQEPLCAENAYRELTAVFECSKCGCFNPPYVKYCRGCKKRFTTE